MYTPPHTSDFVNANGIRLHYLDWGGQGPVLLFLTGMGCSAYIYGGFAPRFCDRFHVLALDRRGEGDSDYPETGYDADTLTEDLRQFLDALAIDRVILVGHSLARIELWHFAALYPERALKLVFLDAAYDVSVPEYAAVWAQNPLAKLQPAWPQDAQTLEEYTATVKRYYPPLAVIWDEAFDEQTRHTVRVTPEGKVVDKMSDAITSALNATAGSYVPEYARIQTPVLSFYAILDGSDYLSSDYMSEEQQAQVIAFFKTVLQPGQRKVIEDFQRHLPGARVVEIPGGHHYCFLKHPEIVFDAMSRFLQ